MAGIETSASEIVDQLGDCDDYGDNDVLDALAKKTKSDGTDNNNNNISDGSNTEIDSVDSGTGAFTSAADSSAGSHTGLVVGIIILVLLLVGVIIFFLWYKRTHENEGKGGIPTSAMLTNNAIYQQANSTGAASATAATNEMYMAAGPTASAGLASNQMYMASAGGVDAGADKSGTVNSIYAVPMDESMLAGSLEVENGQYADFPGTGGEGYGTYETVDANA